MEWYILIFSYALLGSGIKYIDQAYDLGIFNRKTAILMAVLMGILMGSLASVDPISAMFFLSFVIFALVSHKIDNPAFYLGTLLVFLVPFIKSVYNIYNYQINWLILSVLIFSGWIDEKGNALADQKKMGRVLGMFFYYRMFMKVVVLILALASIIPLVYFFAFMAYDLAYLGVGIYSRHQLIKYNISKINGFKRG